MVTSPCRLLIVYHSRTGLAHDMAEHIEVGALAAARDWLEGRDPQSLLAVSRKRARDTTTQDLLSSDAFVFCAPENLASLSGEMKEFFDLTYYDVFENQARPGVQEELVSRILGRPVAIAVASGSDGTSAARQMERICVGWRLEKVMEPLICSNHLEQTKSNILQVGKACTEQQREQCRTVGGTIAATLMLAQGF